MHQVWKIAFTVAGIGAIAFFVFLSLYQRWLELPIFAQLSSVQTFVVMLLFLFLTFGALVGGLWVWLRTQTGQTTHAPVGPDAPTDGVSLFQLGYDLRGISTLQTFMSKEHAKDVTKLERDVRRLVRAAGLTPHTRESGDELISFYYDQINRPLRQVIFNLGFQLAQVEFGRMLMDAGKADDALKVMVKAGMMKALADLREGLEKVGAEAVLNGFPDAPSERQIVSLKAAIINRLRSVSI